MGYNSHLTRCGGNVRCAVGMQGRKRCSASERELRVPLEHPLPLIRQIVGEALSDDRSSVGLEKLLRTLLLQVFSAPGKADQL